MIGPNVFDIAMRLAMNEIKQITTHQKAAAQGRLRVISIARGHGALAS
jgi:hypothetical protein